MKVVFKASANRDLKAAARWYKKQHPALGERFRGAIEETLDRICTYPASGQECADGVRYAVVSIFPYVLWYAVKDDCIVVHAVSHTHRKPGYWKT